MSPKLEVVPVLGKNPKILGDQDSKNNPRGGLCSLVFQVAGGGCPDCCPRFGRGGSPNFCRLVPVPLALPKKLIQGR